MAFAVSIAGIAVAAIGVLGVVAPSHLVQLLRRWPLLTRLPTTVALRLGFGTLFLLAAPHCRVEDLVHVIGALELAAVVALVGLGPARLRSFVTWWLERPSSFVRAWCSGAVVFGAVIAFAGGWPGQAS